MENYEGCTSKRPTDSNVHFVDLKKASTPIAGLKWIRHGAPPNGADVRLYDIGTFSIATVGQPNDVLTGVIGELWIAYQIEFFKPKFNGSIGGNLLMDHYRYGIPAGGWTTSNPFGNGVISPLLPNGIASAGTKIVSSETDTTTGLDAIAFNSTHVGMTFMVVMIWGGDTPLENLSQINWHTDDEHFLNLPDGAANNNGAGGSGHLLQSSINMYRFKVLPNSDNVWHLKFFLSDGYAFFENGTMNVFVTQVNGTQDLPPL